MFQNVHGECHVPITVQLEPCASPVRTVVSDLNVLAPSPNYCRSQIRPG